MQKMKRAQFSTNAEEDILNVMNGTSGIIYLWSLVGMAGCQSLREHRGRNNFVLYVLGMYNVEENGHVVYGNPTQSGAVVVQESQQELLIPVAYCARAVE